MVSGGYTDTLYAFQFFVCWHPVHVYSPVEICNSRTLLHGHFQSIWVLFCFFFARLGHSKVLVSFLSLEENTSRNQPKEKRNNAVFLGLMNSRMWWEKKKSLQISYASETACLKATGKEKGRQEEILRDRFFPIKLISSLPPLNSAIRL